MKEKVNSLNFRILFLAIVFTVAFVGMSYPYGFPLFSMVVGVITGVAFFYFMFGRGIKLVDSFDKFFLVSYAFLICGYLYAWIISNGDMNYLIEKDFRNMISLSLLLISLLILVRNKKDVETIYKYFSLLIILLMVPIGILGIQKIYLLSNGIFLEKYFYNGNYYRGTSLVSDYNSYTLSHIFALIFVITNFHKTRQFIIKVLCISAGTIFFINIFLSASRRGLVILGVLILCYGIYVFYNMAKSLFYFLSKKIKKTYIQNGGILIIGLVVLIIISPKLSINDTTEFDALLSRASSILNLLESNGNEENSFSQRTKRWDASAQMIEEYSLARKIFGNGFQYQWDITRYIKSDAIVDYPHNLLISLLLSNGILGLAVSCFIIIYVTYMVFKMRYNYPNLLYLYGIMLTYILISIDQWFSLKPFIVFIFLIFTVFRYRNFHE